MPLNYEALLDFLVTRRSIRRFRSDSLPSGTAEKLVEAARWAPSAANRQAWRILAIESAGLREQMGAAVTKAVDNLRQQARPDLHNQVGRYLDNFLHFAQAPLVLVPIFRDGPDLLAGVCAGQASHLERGSLCSIAAAIQNLLLAAHALGLGACWMTGPLVAASALNDLLQIPEGWQIAAIIPVGIPDEAPVIPPRRDLARLLQKAS
jgi:nitroreductase